jgi:hypothetical protein
LDNGRFLKGGVTLSLTLEIGGHPPIPNGNRGRRVSEGEAFISDGTRGYYVSRTPPGQISCMLKKDTRHKTQDTRHKTQDTRHKTQDTRQTHPRF